MKELGEITLTELQRIVDKWIKEIGHGYFSPLTNMAVLTEETGEVARQMSRLYGDQTFKPGETANLADELADVVWVVAACTAPTTRAGQPSSSCDESKRAAALLPF